MVYKHSNRKKGKGTHAAVKAKLPSWIPYIGGKTLRASLARRGIAAIARQEIKKDTPTKLLTLPYVQPLTTLTQNTMYSHSPLQYITEGVTATQRVGTKLCIRNLKYEGTFLNVSGVQCKVRFIGVWHDKRLTSSTAANWESSGTTTLAPTDMFLSYNDGVNAPIDRRVCNPVFDRIFDITPKVSSTVLMKKIQFTIPMYSKKTYLSDTSPFLKDKQFYLIMIPWVTGGTSGVTVAGNVYLSPIITFCDV